MVMKKKKGKNKTAAFIENLKGLEQRRVVERTIIEKKSIEKLKRKKRTTVEAKIIWPDIHFIKDFIILKSINNINIAPVHVRGVFEKMNLIKEDYFNRLYGNTILSNILSLGKLKMGFIIGRRELKTINVS